DPLGLLLGGEAREPQAGDALEPFLVGAVDRAEALEALVEASELREADRGLEVRELEVVADRRMPVVAARPADGAPLVLQRAETRVERVVVRDDHAPLARRDRLVGRE